MSHTCSFTLTHNAAISWFLHRVTPVVLLARLCGSSVSPATLLFVHNVTEDYRDSIRVLAERAVICCCLSERALLQSHSIPSLQQRESERDTETRCTICCIHLNIHRLSYICSEPGHISHQASIQFLLAASSCAFGVVAVKKRRSTVPF